VAGAGARRLERVVGRFGTIDVIERQSDGARLYVQDGQLQSFARPGGASLFAYVQAMRAVLVQAGAQRIAVLGGAGGTLATMMAQRGVSAVLVDINPDAFALAKRYFWLAPEVACVVADAHRFLRDGRELFDAIVLDAFGGDDMPAHLATVGFFSLVRRRLLPQGLVLVNAPVDRRQRSRADSLATAIAACGMTVTVFDGPRQVCRNALIVGGHLGDTIELALGDEPPETRRELASLARLASPARGSAATARATALGRRATAR
jgi:spermidine synthase